LYSSAAPTVQLCVHSSDATVLSPLTLQADSPKLRFVVTLWDSASSEVQAELPYPVLSYEQVLEQGRALLDRQGFEPAR
jgi:hypothetical protein